MLPNKSVNRSWLAFWFFNVVSFVYNFRCAKVNSVGPPTRLPQSLDSRSKAMCKKINATHAQALDGVSSLGNLNHWGGWRAALEEAIESKREQEKPLTCAASYVAWLLLSSEHIAYRLRWFLYARCDLQKPRVFDYCYQTLLNECQKAMPVDVYEYAKFAVKVRHILIHKGFPNLQKAPMARWGGADSEAEFRQIRETIKNPGNYRLIKDRFDAVHSWLITDTTSVKFGI